MKMTSASIYRWYWKVYWKYTFRRWLLHTKFKSKFGEIEIKNLWYLSPLYFNLEIFKLKYFRKQFERNDEFFDYLEFFDCSKIKQKYVKVEDLYHGKR